MLEKFGTDTQIDDYVGDFNFIMLGIYIKKVRYAIFKCVYFAILHSDTKLLSI